MGWRTEKALWLALGILQLDGLGALTGDIILPGYRRSDEGSERIRIANVARHEGYSFHLWPRDLDRGIPGNTVVPVGEDGTASLSGMNPLVALRDDGSGAIQLIAVSRAMRGAWDSDPERVLASGSGVLRADTGLAPPEPVPVWVGRRSRTRVVEVRGLPDRLEVVLVGTEIAYGPWAVRRRTAALAFIGVACAGGFGLVTRRRRMSGGSLP